MNVELNLTLQCNVRCPGCDRACNLYPERTEHMAVEQVTAFLDQAWKRVGTATRIDKVKLVGGEPLMHPAFWRIYWDLVDALGRGAIREVKINTNGILPRSKNEQRIPAVRWLISPLKKKAHLPYLWSPADLGFSTTGPCSHPKSCGFSLDNLGWLPCSPAIMIVRAFGMDHLYRKEMPDGKVWGVDELCRHCVYSMPAEWRKAHCKPLAQFTEEDKTPTKSWAEALTKYGG